MLANTLLCINNAQKRLWPNPMLKWTKIEKWSVVRGIYGKVRGIKGPVYVATTNGHKVRHPLSLHIIWFEMIQHLFWVCWFGKGVKHLKSCLEKLSHVLSLFKEMSFSRDASITLIRPSFGYRWVSEMSLSKRCFDNPDTPFIWV